MCSLLVQNLINSMRYKTGPKKKKKGALVLVIDAILLHLFSLSSSDIDSLSERLASH